MCNGSIRREWKYVHVLGHSTIGSVAVCGTTLGEEIICSLERAEDGDMVSEDVIIYVLPGSSQDARNLRSPGRDDVAITGLVVPP
jgi:hypothetical protein